jgi:hypothetical protein
MEGLQVAWIRSLLTSFLLQCPARLTPCTRMCAFAKLLVARRTSCFPRWPHAAVARLPRLSPQPQHAHAPPPATRSPQLALACTPTPGHPRTHRLACGDRRICRARRTCWDPRPTRWSSHVLAPSLDLEEARHA